ncbi:hypothetical protein RDV89_09410 [Nocardioides zeae]|uniref:Integral membrane protein n=1 Tax=Nocardioides imazamoxiresistens TaxID=3231893 RepID=A0ABU3PVL7_9ACTN|nr:hypothetical protein [Nocardioides zeae]MDT9593283.1 hypothetical protein [Nocardioides zeae]
MGAVRTGLGVLLALAFAVLAPAALTASWASSQVDDTDAYVENVAQLADDPLVVDEVTTRLTSALDSTVANQLGAEASAVASPSVATAVRDVVGSEQFDTAWREANRVAHEQLVRVLRGDATTADGDLAIDLTELYNAAAALLRDDGIEVADRPDGGLTFRTAPPDRLDDAQEAYQAVVAGGAWLPVAALVVLALAVLVAPGRARIVVGLVAAVGTVVTTGLLLAGVSAGQEIAELQVAAADRDLAAAVLGALLGELRNRAWWVLGIAAVAAVALVVVPLVVGALGRRRAGGRPPAPVY